MSEVVEEKIKCCVEERRKSMNTLKEKVMELLMKRIGVVENEEFEACCKNSVYSTYKFHKDELLLKDSEEDWHKTDMWSMFIKYFKECRFKKRPFKSNGGETYFYVDTDGVIIGAMFLKYRILGIRNEILKILKGEDDE